MEEGFGEGRMMGWERFLEWEEEGGLLKLE